MAPVNLTAPGWTVAKGQAVWQVAPGEELAGELLIATRPDGAAFVQFIKTPFPLVLAQVTTNQWEIQFPARHKRYSGRGKPPARLLWLNLPQAVTGKPLPKPWHWREEPNGWRLENSATGESLEGYFIGS